ncbi:hypothetical protein IIA79_03315 [bacterium]|nr:hypothetical protein [bacterium]
MLATGSSRTSRALKVPAARDYLHAAAVLALAVAINAPPAHAASPSEVVKLPGRAYVVRAAPQSKWLAAWSEQSDGRYTLYVIDANNGNRQEVTTVDDPGGLCWIPNRESLFYCRGVYSEKLESTRVYYYTYDAQTKASKKIVELNDIESTYQFDPIAAEDGSRVFHMTINTRSLPSFNVYLPGTGTMNQLEAGANIGADYDLSSDGKMLYWFLTDDDGNLYFAGWDLEVNDETWNAKYPAAMDPVEDHALIKVHSPRQQIATIVFKEDEPQLQLCVYNFLNAAKPYVTPVYLDAGENALDFDWKGRSNILYVLTRNENTSEFSILEIDPLTNSQTELLRTKDEIVFVDYAPGSQTYYFTIVDDRGARNAQTLVMRLR